MDQFRKTCLLKKSGHSKADLVKFCLFSLVQLEILIGGGGKWKIFGTLFWWCFSVMYLWLRNWNDVINDFYKVWFCHIQFEKRQFWPKHTTSGHQYRKLRRLFWKFVAKIRHFRHISAKIQPKHMKLVHYLFLAVRGNISIGWEWAGSPGFLATPLCFV